MNKKSFISKLFQKIRNFYKQDDAAVIPEFALAALPYFLLVFGTIQVSMLYWANLELENASNTASRLILTGQQPSEQVFKQVICSQVAILNITNCEGALTVDVRQLAGGFGDIASGGFDPRNEDGDPDTPQEANYENIQGDSVAIVTVFYRWPRIFSLLGGNMTNGDSLLRSSFAMRTEPYTSVTPFTFNNSSGESNVFGDTTMVVPTSTTAIRESKRLEVSIMLDVTGSMSGDLSSLKTAAKQFIDILIPDENNNEVNGEKKVRIALVPYASMVNVRPFINAVRRTSPPLTLFKRTNSSNTFMLTDHCVSERNGAHNFSDNAPDTPGNKIFPIYVWIHPNQVFNIETNIIAPHSINDIEGKTVQQIESQGLLSQQQIDDLIAHISDINCQVDYQSSSDTSYKLQSEVIPLTDNVSSLKTEIDAFQARGATSGHIGTAWAWYALSPKWSGVWPNESEPVAYNTENVTKIAVLMTDGQYNTEYNEGLDTWYPGVGGSPNGNSDSQADTLCVNMKASGIVIYTVGYRLSDNPTAYSTMQNCASSTTEHFFTPSTTNGLIGAFQNIANQISRLRLSN